VTDATTNKPRTPTVRQRRVLLSPRDLEDAARLLELLANSEPVPSAPTTLPERSDMDPDALRERAVRIRQDRRRRSAIFGPEMFGEPAWEMLLLLYLEDGRERQTQARLAELSGASRSTAWRWIEYLEHNAFIWRETHPTDKRKIFVQLTNLGRERLELYLSETNG